MSNPGTSGQRTKPEPMLRGHAFRPEARLRYVAFGAKNSPEVSQGKADASWARISPRSTLAVPGLRGEKQPRSIGRRGSTFVAAIALVFLIFAVTAVTLVRVASIYAQAAARHNSTRALFLAEAGIQKAAHRLVSDTAYTGERGTKLATGTFDVTLSRGNGGYVVTSTGHSDSPFRLKPKKTVRAVVRVSGGSFRIADWREDP